MGFAELLEKSKDYQGKIYHLIKTLSPSDVEQLYKEIETWDHSTAGLVKLNLMMKDFCNLDIPVKDFQEFLKNDLRLALEVYAERVYDTYNRDIAVDGFLIHLGVGIWPRYGDNKEYRKQFHQRLEEKARQLGYWME